MPFAAEHLKWCAGAWGFFCTDSDDDGGGGSCVVGGGNPTPESSRTRESGVVVATLK